MAFIEKQSFTVKHPFVWRVFTVNYNGGRFEVYHSIDESKAQKALDALKRYGITSRKEYWESPVYFEFIKNGANIA